MLNANCLMRRQRDQGQESEVYFAKQYCNITKKKNM